MINLLPRKQKLEVKREYLYRLSTVSVLVLAVVGSIGGALMLPSLFATSVRSDAVTIQAELIGGIGALEEQAETFAVLLDAKKKIEIFEKKPIEVVHILEEVIMVAPSTMTLNSFVFENREGDIQILTIGGTARTRDELVEFSRDLEIIPYIADVELPVSNLAANRDINFSLKMSIETP